MSRMMLCSALLLLASACRPDDVDDTAGGTEDGGAATDGGSTTDGGSSEDGGSAGDGGSEGACSGLSLLGDWVSEGGDISPLFQGVPYEYTKVEASFEGDCTYEATATTQGGDVYVLTGVYTATEGTPGTIVQEQDPDAQLIAEGIWQVDGDVMQFEVVVTTPNYGFTPPTPSAGFGSTSGGTLSPGDNLQIYRRP